MTARRRAIFGTGAGLLLAAGALAWAWPGLAASPLERGRTAFARKDWAASEALALAALKARPDDPEALLLLARASGRLGRDDVARAIYARPGLPKLEAEDCLAIAAGHHRRGDAHAALRRLEQGLGLDPDHADILHLLALYRDSLGQPTRAEGLAARLAAQPGQAARGDLLLGTLRDRLADPAGAAEALERALKADPTLAGLTPKPPEARKLLARDHLKLGRPDLARADLLPLGDDDPEAAWLLGRAWLQEGRGDLAASALARAGGYGSDRPTAPEPAPFVGSAECASCHESIFKAQQGSRHARTFHAGPDLARLPWPEGPMPDPVDPAAIRHRVIVDGDRVDWETRVGDEAARAAIRFAFGSGDRGVTPVGVDAKGRFRELRLSHYGDADAWDLTTGHPAKTDPMTADGALGQALGPDELRTCLGCHTTDFRVSRDRVGPTAKEAGIGCERCHGPCGNHLKAAALGFSDPAIARPKRATAAQVTALCAGCHSPGDRPVSRDDPASARFQGTTLTWSRCYQESQGRLSCVTCHDAATGPATYEAKCLACHAPKPTGETPDPAGLPSLAPEPTGHPCPVSPSRDCIRCHMPTTTAATRHTTFADHHIRIHRPGEAKR